MKLRTILFLALLAGCGNGPTSSGSEDSDLTVLFVGNSLTYVNDLPLLVRTVAESAGHSVRTVTVASPDYSLEDHWRTGIATVIREVRPDVVVMQQGPSSLPENQIYLRVWTDTLAKVIREVGARPALFMVWPSSDRYSFFADVRTSYRNAAVSVGGDFMPAGQAWIEAWAQDPALALYGSDGFHPSRLGSQVAAITIFGVLFRESVTGLPARMTPTSSGLPTIDLGPAAATVLSAVDAAVREWGIPAGR